MTRAEKIAKAQQLRAQGLRLREIAQRMGVAIATVHEWLTDPDRTKAKVRKERYDRPCVDCGVSINSNGLRPVERCFSCRQRHKHETRYWTSEAVVGALQGWTEALGRTPTAEEAQREGAWVAQNIVCREFGSWNAGIEAAGFTPRGHADRNVTGYCCRKGSA